MTTRDWTTEAVRIKKSAKKIMQTRGWDTLVGRDREERWLEARAEAERAAQELEVGNEEA